MHDSSTLPLGGGSHSLEFLDNNVPSSVAPQCNSIDRIEAAFITNSAGNELFKEPRATHSPGSLFSLFFLPNSQTINTSMSSSRSLTLSVAAN